MFDRHESFKVHHASIQKYAIYSTKRNIMIRIGIQSKLRSLGYIGKYKIFKPRFVPVLHVFIYILAFQNNISALWIYSVLIVRICMAVCICILYLLSIHMHIAYKLDQANIKFSDYDRMT